MYVTEPNNVQCKNSSILKLTKAFQISEFVRISEPIDNNMQSPAKYSNGPYTLTNTLIEQLFY